MRTELPASLPADKRLLVAEFKKAMQELYGERLFQVILYGSYARGDWHEESDIDFLVVLNDEKISIGHEIDRITDTSFDMDLRFQSIISSHPVSRKRFDKGENALFFFIKKEGIVA